MSTWYFLRHVVNVATDLVVACERKFHSNNSVDEQPNWNAHNGERVETIVDVSRSGDSSYDTRLLCN